MRSCEISLSKFLSRYARVKGYNLNYIRHSDVKILFPHLKRASYDNVRKNRELLYSGQVIFVNDGYNTLPYYIPEKIEINNFECDEVCSKCEDDFVVDNNEYDYTSLSEYELRQLLRRKYNSSRNQKNARKELKSRGLY